MAQSGHANVISVKRKGWCNMGYSRKYGFHFTEMSEYKRIRDKMASGNGGYCEKYGFAYTDRNDYKRKLYKYGNDGYSQMIKRHRKNTYGLTDEQYRQILEEQNYQCANPRCDGAPEHIDHDHSFEKGDVNGVKCILCGGCNSARGLLANNSERMIGLSELQNSLDNG